jgi:predicted deacylase
VKARGTVVSANIAVVLAVLASGADLAGPRLAGHEIVGPPRPEAVQTAAVPPPAEATPPPWGSIEFLGEEIDPGEKRRLFLRAGESFAGSGIDIPALVVRGAAHGPTLCLTAGVHGDELNGIEIVRQLFEDTSTLDLKGMLIGYPVVNLHGFRASSRYLPDRRDLNRYFPGNANGSTASRIANAVFRTLVEVCDALVDFHTGSFHRTNLPQIRADLSDERVLALAQAFGVGVVVHSYGMRGTLRRSASEADLPSITYEAGEPMRFAQQEITYGVEGLRNLMASLGMLASDTPEHAAEVYRRSRWVRVNDGGIFLTSREVGESVEEGDVLGTVTDPVTNDRSTLRAPFDGRIIGMALPQVVIPGFATFHLGLRERNGDDEDGAETLSPDQLDAVEEPE